MSLYPRETIMSALITQLQTAVFAQKVAGVTTWQTIQRKVLTFEQVTPGMQPACFVANHSEDWTWTSETLVRVFMTATLYVMVNTKGAAVPGQWVNLVMDAIATALAPPASSDRQTLGGIVRHCRIKGRVLVDAGDVDGQALLLVPVELLLP
jgi:hypothetical protein